MFINTFKRIPFFITGVVICSVLCGPLPPAHGKLNVVATTTDLAAIVEEVGKNLVQVDFICRGYQDPHYVDPKPSFMVLVNRADLLVYHGLDLEGSWLPQFIEGSRNRSIRFGQTGNLDMSIAIDTLLDIPAGVVDRSMGDIHPFGNPHYTNDPQNVMKLADFLADRLSILDPKNGPAYRRQAMDFKNRLGSRLKEWLKRLKPFAGSKVVTYHRNWSYFFNRFGLDYLGNVEIRPGILPSPRHLAELAMEMKRRNSRVIFNANYYPSKWSRLLARKTGARVVVLPIHVLGAPEIKTYFDLMEFLVSSFERELSRENSK